MLTGRAPFVGTTPQAVADAHLRQAPRAPGEVISGIPRDVDAIVLKALSKNPDNRYQTADQMRTDIERALAIVQGRLGIIPQEAADEIVSHCDINQIDMDKLRAQTERIGYPVVLRPAFKIGRAHV